MHAAYAGNICIVICTIRNRNKALPDCGRNCLFRVVEKNKVRTG